jgi:hypothetical protein
MTDVKQLKAMLETLMEKVEAMERGGDLESLLEKEIGTLKTSVYEAALDRRERTAEEADFSPSDL